VINLIILVLLVFIFNRTIFNILILFPVNLLMNLGDYLYILLVGLFLMFILWCFSDN